MVSKGEKRCPKCGGELKRYGSTKRIVRISYGRCTWIKISRLSCSKCGSIHRELPNYIMPYKQYDSRIIQGVLNGSITYDTIGYEDYPCEMTMNRWLIQMIKD